MSDPSHMSRYNEAVQIEQCRREIQQEKAMQEKPPVETPPVLCGWVKLFHSRGPQVTLPVPPDPIKAFSFIGDALDAGWLVQAPGLEQGEERETVGWVLRTGFERDGEVTPTILLYSTNDQLTYSFLKVYLNRPEDREAFEFAAKMKLAAIPDYDGNDKPERGKSAKTDKYIVPVKPFGVVFKENPKYDAAEKARLAAKGEVYKVPKRVFVRWVDQMPAKAENVAPEPSGTQEKASPKPALTIVQFQDWKTAVKGRLDRIKGQGHKAEQLTRDAEEVKNDMPEGSRVEAGKYLAALAAIDGLKWEKSMGMYVIDRSEKLEEAPF